MFLIFCVEGELYPRNSLIFSVNRQTDRQKKYTILLYKYKRGQAEASLRLNRK